MAGVFGNTVMAIVFVEVHRSGLDAVPFEPVTVNVVLVEGVAFTGLPFAELRSVDGDQV